MKSKMIPELRFPEFDREWEEKKLGEILSFKNGVNAPKEKYGKGYKFINVLDIIENDFITHERIKGAVDVSEDVFMKNIVEYGDILFQRSSETREEVGQSNVYLDKNEPAIFGGFVIRGKKIEDYFPAFMNYLLKTSHSRKEITTKSGGSTRYNVGQVTLSNVKIITTHIPEQTKIASFLTAVDKRINLLQKKKAELTQYKKGVLQLIMENGKLKVENGKLKTKKSIRFKPSQSEIDELMNNGKIQLMENGEWKIDSASPIIFNSQLSIFNYKDWEEKKLGEVAEIKRGASPRPISASKWFDDESKIGWVRISDVSKSNKYLEKTLQYLSDKGVQKSRLVKPGNMIMSICATIGKPIYTNFETCIHDGFVVFKNPKIEKEYLYYFLQKIQNRWYRYGQPGTQVNLNIDIVSNEKIPYPTLPEQKKIADFLSSIDKSIEKVKKQIEASQKWKQGLLQKMFV